MNVRVWFTVGGLCGAVDKLSVSRDDFFPVHWLSFFPSIYVGLTFLNDISTIGLWLGIKRCRKSNVIGRMLNVCIFWAFIKVFDDLYWVSTTDPNNSRLQSNWSIDRKWIRMNSSRKSNLFPPSFPLNVASAYFIHDLYSPTPIRTYNFNNIPKTCNRFSNTTKLSPYLTYTWCWVICRRQLLLHQTTCHQKTREMHKDNNKNNTHIHNNRRGISYAHKFVCVLLA